jgi:hypothetical protein
VIDVFLVESNLSLLRTHEAVHAKYSVRQEGCCLPGRDSSIVDFSEKWSSIRIILGPVPFDCARSFQQTMEDGGQGATSHDWFIRAHKRISEEFVWRWMMPEC